MSTEEYFNINKQTWNDKTQFHINSSFYNNDEFIGGKSSLNEIDLRILGDVSGKSILHLQCHFGQDTISLERLGASVVGVDFSDKAIEFAKEMAVKTNTKAEFICCNIYDLAKYLDRTFDIVYTSYGTIGWLPNLDKWAEIVQKFVKKDGKLILIEFHPFLWMYDNDFKRIEYSYFNDEAIIEDEQGTYADREAALEARTVTWNHPISEVIGSLLAKDFSVEAFEEYNYSPYNIFSSPEELEKGKYTIHGFGNKLPLVYSLVCVGNGEK